MKLQRSRTTSWIVVIAAGLIATATPASPVFAGQSAGRSACTPRIIDLGTLGGANSEIDGANRTGVWVGSADNARGVPTPVLWRGSAIHRLGESDGFAGDVTNAGVVVGVADMDSPSSTAFWWYRGTAHALPTPSWAVASSARRINQHDDAVGTLTAADGTSLPVEWRRLQDVRVLPLPAAAVGGGEALGINDAGDVVGDISTDAAQIAWEWGPTGSGHALQPAYLQGFSQANLINDRGVAAGGLDFGGQPGLWAATWNRGSVNKLGEFGSEPDFTFAFGQDQLGDYVGFGTYDSNDSAVHVFLTHAGSGTMLTMLPLSGDLHDRSNAHAVVPEYLGQPGIAVGGDSTTTAGDDHATVWTCAFQQAFHPPTVSTAARASRRAPAWKRLLDHARP
jgi:uncharacterized membrane protein